MKCVIYKIFFRSTLSAKTPAKGEKIIKAVTLKVSAEAKILAECSGLIWNANNANPIHEKASPKRLIVCAKYNFTKTLFCNAFNGSKRRL